MAAELVKQLLKMDNMTIETSSFLFLYIFLGKHNIISPTTGKERTVRLHGVAVPSERLESDDKAILEDGGSGSCVQASQRYDSVFQTDAFVVSSLFPFVISSNVIVIINMELGNWVKAGIVKES